MRLLLDTQIFLWWLADSRKLAKATRERIEAADEVYVSAASIVECEQKISSGLLEADAHELARGIRASGFTELPVRAKPAADAASLKPQPGVGFLRPAAGRPGHARAAAVPHRERGAEAVFGARRGGVDSYARLTAPCRPYR